MSKIIRIFLIFFSLKNFEITLLLKWSPIFDSPPLIQNSKFNNFLWICWFLCKHFLILYLLLENSTTRIAIVRGPDLTRHTCKLSLTNEDPSHSRWELRAPAPQASLELGHYCPGQAQCTLIRFDIFRPLKYILCIWTFFYIRGRSQTTFTRGGG